jgi:alkyl sulfatase BDS1-like metallo-beta-lactamase superfamily hydrolase
MPLLPQDHAKRHVDLIGRDRILAEGRDAIGAGDYRWAVQVLHHLVYADPQDTEAKELQADAYEQLGYQAEVPQYRAIFLTTAQELRDGVRTEGGVHTDSLDTILAMPIDLLFDFAGVHVIGKAAAGAEVRLNLTFTGPGTPDGEPWTMWVRHGVLNARPGHVDDAQLGVTGPKPAETIAAHSLATDGDTAVLDVLASLMDVFDPHFNIATP